MAKGLSLNPEELAKVASKSVKDASSSNSGAKNDSAANNKQGLNKLSSALSGSTGRTNATGATSATGKGASLDSTGFSGGKWKVPILEDGFSLDSAKDRAYQLAEHYMNGVLTRDDLQIKVELDDEVGNRIGKVSDMHTGEQVNSYVGTDLLKLYAQNFKERGIIVDGRV